MIWWVSFNINCGVFASSFDLSRAEWHSGCILRSFHEGAVSVALSGIKWAGHRVTASSFCGPCCFLVEAFFGSSHFWAICSYSPVVNMYQILSALYFALSCTAPSTTWHRTVIFFSFYKDISVIERWWFCLALWGGGRSFRSYHFPRELFFFSLSWPISGLLCLSYLFPLWHKVFFIFKPVHQSQ